LDDLLGQGARRLADALRQQHREVRCDVAVLRIAGPVELYGYVVGAGQLTRNPGELRAQRFHRHQPDPAALLPDELPFDPLPEPDELPFEPLSALAALSLFVLPLVSFSAAFL